MVAGLHVLHVRAQTLAEREDVVGEDDGAGPQLRRHQLEHRQIEILPAVEEHQVDRLRQVTKGLQGVSQANVGDLRESGFRTGGFVSG